MPTTFFESGSVRPNGRPVLPPAGSSARAPITGPTNGCEGRRPKALLALGRLESLALPGDSYRLAFTPGLISQVYQRESSALLPTPAACSASRRTAVVTSISTATAIGGCPPAESSTRRRLQRRRRRPKRRQHFYLPRRFEDPFGKAAAADYDPPNDLLLTQTTDAVSNIRASQRLSRSGAVAADRSQWQPGAVGFDALGMVAGTAVMGKTTENLGDSLGGFVADLAQARSTVFMTPMIHTPLPAHCWPPPPRASSTTRSGSGPPAQPLPLILQNGSRCLPRRWRARPTSAILPKGKRPRSRSASLFRWLRPRDPEQNSGRTGLRGRQRSGDRSALGRQRLDHLQQQGKTGPPVRAVLQSLPSGHQFEFGVQVGVSPILFYDPVERVVATLHPNHTYEKVVFDPWHQQSWDANDTVVQADPTADPDVGNFFQRLPSSDFLPTWYTQKSAGDAQEQDAATKAAAHANTPATAYFDSLGRTFLTVADTGGGIKFATRVELDIQGNQRSVRDAVVQAGDQQGRVVMRYDYDMLQNRIYQASMEAGERWILNDCMGKSIRSWDTRGHNFRTEYDTLRRVVILRVQGRMPPTPIREPEQARCSSSTSHTAKDSRTIRR